MAILADFVKETTNTTGIGTVTLVAVDGFAEFADAFANGTEVYYAIHNGDNRETGIGTVGAGKTLARTTPQVTLVGGVFDDTSPTAITLVGESTVFVSSNADAFNTRKETYIQTTEPTGTNVGDIWIQTV